MEESFEGKSLEEKKEMLRKAFQELFEAIQRLREQRMFEKKMELLDALEKKFQKKRPPKRIGF